MAYRGLSDPQPKTESPPILRRDYARYWVRLALRSAKHWSGPVAALFAYLTIDWIEKSPTVLGVISIFAWGGAMVWAVIWCIECGPAVFEWAGEKDRMEG